MQFAGHWLRPKEARQMAPGQRMLVGVLVWLSSALCSLGAARIPRLVGMSTFAAKAIPRS